MKNIISFLLSTCLLLPATSHAQDKFYTKQGRIYFDATGGMEKVEATSAGAVCVLDTHTGAVQFAVLLKGFEFEKALMQEHFNENYVESDKYPRAEFRGQIINNQEIAYKKNGTYPARVKGKLTLHGETKEISCEGNLTIKDGRITVTGDFVIPLADYHIAIPSLVKDKVAQQVKIRVDCLLDALNN
ncbi:MAG TPA: YceI family protein [Puia sp.]|nr:YceI family protein [Puia sp.]